jgi:hypothetical protein
MTISDTLFVQCMRELTQATVMVNENLKWMSYGYYWGFQFHQYPKIGYKYMHHCWIQKWGDDDIPDCTSDIVRGHQAHRKVIISSKFEARTNETVITRASTNNTWHIVDKHVYVYRYTEQ